MKFIHETLKSIIMFDTDKKPGQLKTICVYVELISHLKRDIF